jgi:CBS domain-containing protein
MLARDIMTAEPITVSPETTVEACARLLLDKRISAVPVVDESGHMIGIVSEGDLIHRRESGTERRYSWWLELVSDPQALARDYIKSVSHKVADVMTRQVVSVNDDAPLSSIAELLEKRRIKRVPVMKNGKLAGIVSRADLVRALLAGKQAPEKGATSDADIREHFLERLNKEPWGPHSYVNIIVEDGKVELWGFAGSKEEARAIGLLAEDIAGVKTVTNNVKVGDLSRYML